MAYMAYILQVCKAWEKTGDRPKPIPFPNPTGPMALPWFEVHRQMMPGLPSNLLKSSRNSFQRRKGHRWTK